MKITIDESNIKLIKNLINYNYERIIDNCFISGSGENPCHCVILNRQGIKLFRKLGLYVNTKKWEGLEGHLSSQYPRTPNILSWLGDVIIGDIKIDVESSIKEKTAIETILHDFLTGLSYAGDPGISLYDFRCYEFFNTDVVELDSLVEHFFDERSLALFESTEYENEFFLTFVNNKPDEYTKEYFDSEYKKFDTLESAHEYIKSFKMHGESWEDVSISKRIWDDLK